MTGYSEEQKPNPEWIARLVADSPSIVPTLIARVQHTVGQCDAALADSRIDDDSPAAAWLRTIRRTLTDDNEWGRDR